MQASLCILTLSCVIQPHSCFLFDFIAVIILVKSSNYETAPSLRLIHSPVLLSPYVCDSSAAGLRTERKPSAAVQKSIAGSMWFCFLQTVISGF